MTRTLVDPPLSLADIDVDVSHKYYPIIQGFWSMTLETPP